ncbi:hypothetical protein [Methylovulum psychrotolerans]|jgi:hypothetical protein|uniref:Uncharacterized protein n=1 Tax=Methylovulum psychrotolerans TaxID=1704499 RepID=A0A1Z4BTR0_9GAMM|nr:hypothetical protein [Methylovulum psychrotolerans]ASF44648.1 hypothetical protein CEK71_00415 [Methylovulum psychrotolerans]
MNQNYLSGFFFPAVAGLFFFMKRHDDEGTHVETHIAAPVYAADASGLTGVARYLESQRRLLEADKEEAESLEEQRNTQVITGVAKYLEKAQQTPVSGVTRYMLKKSLAEKNAPKPAAKLQLTGVAKYLSNQKDAPVLSGVAKYLKKQESLPPATKVAKYMAKQALAAKQAKPAVIHIELTGVEKYLKQQEDLPQLSKVAKYMRKQALLAKLEKPAAVAKPELTGVAKYLQNQDSLPKISRVTKYMARQALANKNKIEMIETGVDKYMRNRA